MGWGRHSAKVRKEGSSTGRKEQQQAREQSQQLFDWQQNVSNEQLATQREGRAAVTPRATALADDTGYSQQLQQRLGALTRDEGYSPEEQSALTQETTGAVSSAYGKAREGMARRVAATGNTAGYGSSVADLAREEAKSLGSSTRQNKLAFADERRQRMMQNYGFAQGAEDEQQRRQEQGTNLLARLYGIDTGAFTSGRGQAQNAADLYSQQAHARSPWFDVGMAALSGGAQVASGALRPKP